MHNAILMLYGNFALHPWQEDMFTRPDRLQAMLHERGLEFHIGCVTQVPSKKDELPTSRIAQNPIYDAEGTLLEANFKAGDISKYPVVIDHWVANFQHEVIHDDGSVERVAHGIGLPAERLINHKSVQTFGNRKDYMHKLLENCGVAIDTFRVHEIDQLAAKYGQQPIIYKPLGGSQSIGIATFDSPHDLKKALKAGKLLPNGLIQPFFDVTQPIKNLIPLNNQQAKRLKACNSTANRPRDLRMHVMVATDSQGQRTIKAYPMLKVGAQGANKLPFDQLIALHPDSFPPDSYIYQKSIEAAEALAQTTGVPYLYGAVDWLYACPPGKTEGQFLVGDFNCRGPGLWHEATPAREAFVELLASMANKNNT